MTTTNNNTLGRIAVYYRVSTNKQDTELQKQVVMEYLVNRPHTSLVEYSDYALSGSKDNRPEFQRLVEDAKQNKIDTLVVYKLDRLSRKASTAIQLILQLSDLKVGFISVTQDILNLSNNIPFKSVILAIFAEFAQLEREQTVERIKAGLKVAREKGVKLGAKFKVTPEEKKRVLAMVKKGFSYKKVARELKISNATVCRIVNA